LKTQKILLIDNYDSFTYNLQHYIEELSGESCTVVRNDELENSLIDKYDAVIISPGPGLPGESGRLMEVIKTFFSKKKMLGVCLGHQALALASGGKLKQLDVVMHGLQRNCTITSTNDPVLADLPPVFSSGRYHSWVIDRSILPDEWIISSVDDTGEVMSMYHKNLPLYGVQFHPESIMTEDGKKILSNWLAI
jgi:anthranilate synthase/aminodeoxychorismate synthase-like glutamine amidotransferase